MLIDQYHAPPRYGPRIVASTAATTTFEPFDQSTGTNVLAQRNSHQSDRPTARFGTQYRRQIWNGMPVGQAWEEHKQSDDIGQDVCVKSIGFLDAFI